MLILRVPTFCPHTQRKSNTNCARIIALRDAKTCIAPITWYAYNFFISYRHVKPVFQECNGQHIRRHVNNVCDNNNKILPPAAIGVGYRSRVPREWWTQVSLFHANQKHNWVLSTVNRCWKRTSKSNITFRNLRRDAHYTLNGFPWGVWGN